MRKVGSMGIAIVALLASAAHAEVPDTATEGGASASLGEIIVTAQRKSESLQKTPIAVTAVTAETTESLGLANAVDLAAITPGASFTTTNGFFSTRIRGIGTDYVSVGLEGPVAIYEDGAYLTRTLTINDILDNFDIASIQVLRGPQGTLYGRNATGGVIIVNSADPTNEFAGKLRTEVGNIDHEQVSGMINLPLGQGLSFRATGGYKHEGGFVTELPTGRKLGGGRTYDVRAKLRYQSDGTDIILGAQYYDTAYSLGPLATLARTDNTCFVCGFGPNVVQPNVGFYNTQSNTSIQPVRTKYSGANLKMTFEIGQLALTSTTTYRKEATRDSSSDQDGTPLPVFEFAVPASGGRSITQDVQITSNFKGPFNFLAGASYLDDKGYFDPRFLGIFFGTPTLDITKAAGFNNDAGTKSYAGFLEGYYNINDNLKVTVGGRYTREKRTAHGFTNAAFAGILGLPGAFSFDQDTTQSAFTPRFVLDWDKGPTNIYYSYTRGFKAGGFPGPYLFPTSPVQPEKIFSHEVGIKQSMLDNRLHLNTAAFYAKNTNQQTQSLDLNSGGTITGNAGAMENYGLEVEAQLNPAKGLNLGFSGARQHARYKPYQPASAVCYDPTGHSNPTAPGATLYACNVDATGTPPPGAPDWTASFNAGYEFPLGSWTGSLSGIATYRSSIYFSPAAGGQLQSDVDGTRWLANASGYISPPGEHLRVGFYANNLFDKQIVAFKQIAQPYGVFYNAGTPRTYGLRLEYSF
jgi:iron complex outermembrane receptor protein